MSLPQYSFQKQPKQQTTSILAIAAGKGGVGKSTVAVNLALALKERGYLVGIIDSDLYGPSIRQMLPEDQMPKQEGEWLLPACSFGIKVISMSYFSREDQATALRGPIANSIINQFLTKVQWGKLDFLLIDFPPGTGDIPITLCQTAKLTAAIMVTTPQLVAIADVRKAFSLFRIHKVPVIGMIENMSYYLCEGKYHYPFGKTGAIKLSQQEEVPLLARLPIEEQISFRCDRGFSLFVEDGQTTAAEPFRQLAKTVEQKLEQKRHLIAKEAI